METLSFPSSRVCVPSRHLVVAASSPPGWEKRGCGGYGQAPVCPPSPRLRAEGPGAPACVCEAAPGSRGRGGGEEGDCVGELAVAAGGLMHLPLLLAGALGSKDSSVKVGSGGSGTAAVCGQREGESLAGRDRVRQKVKNSASVKVTSQARSPSAPKGSFEGVCVQGCSVQENASAAGRQRMTRECFPPFLPSPKGSPGWVLAWPVLPLLYNLLFLPSESGSTQCLPCRSLCRWLLPLQMAHPLKKKKGIGGCPLGSSS